MNDTAVTDEGVHLLAASNHKLQYAAVGGTYVTEIGAAALADRCTLAQASRGKRLERTQFYSAPPFNLCLYRLGLSVEVCEALALRFPLICIFFDANL